METPGPAGMRSGMFEGGTHRREPRFPDRELSAEEANEREFRKYRDEMADFAAAAGDREEFELATSTCKESWAVRRALHDKETRREEIARKETARRKTESEFDMYSGIRESMESYLREMHEKFETAEARVIEAQENEKAVRSRYQHFLRTRHTGPSTLAKVEFDLKYELRNAEDSFEAAVRDLDAKRKKYEEAVWRFQEM